MMINGSGSGLKFMDHELNRQTGLLWQCRDMHCSASRGKNDKNWPLFYEAHSTSTTPSSSTVL